MTQDRHGASSPSPDAREELREDASRLKDTAKHRAGEEAENRKGEAAKSARSASSAFRSAADELEHDADAPDWLGSAMRQAARQIGRAADGLDNRGMDEISRDVSRFARANPMAFLGASAAAGFAAARMLRAGAQRHDDMPVESHDEDRGVSGESGWQDERSHSAGSGQFADGTPTNSPRSASTTARGTLSDTKGGAL
ncbi:MAG: hypothetical protein V2I39_07845 [Erythrobacter sp.]|jgi:hypothetical protein|nr:hypothetical protein [Erythrobacter sp.]